MFPNFHKTHFLSFAAVISLILGLGLKSAGDEVIRIMAANLSSGNGQNYDNGEGNRIFQGLDPDIALVQEMNYLSDTPANFRSWVDVNFGTTFSYVREPAPGNIPNGIVSRYPILDSGEWDDITLTDRDFMWAKIDIPGDKNLWVISVHLKASSGSASQRNSQAGAILSYINSQNIPAADYMVIGGDFNTTSRTEACINTLSAQFVTTTPWPADQAGNGNTNAGRASPYDWVIPDAELNATKTPLVLGTNSFPNGLVYDSRVTSPYSMLPPPILSSDSGASGMQHMAVIRAFLIPSNSAPLIATAANSTSTETVTDPDLSVYEIVRASSVGLGVTATDDGGEAALKYTWSLTSGPGSAVSFSTNGTNASKNTTATFQAIGNYTFSVTVQDTAGLVATSSVKVRVVQAAGSIALTPATASLAVNATQSFSASLLDQFSLPMASQPASFSWSTTGGGTLNSSGLFTATTAGGPFTVTAASGGFTRTASVTVTRAAATISLANLSQTYDGSAKPVTITTSPAGKAVSIIYNGSAVVPVNAGSYPVSVSVTDPNYQGSSTGTLVIQKADATIALAGLTSTYDGNPKPVTATTVPAGRTLSILYAGSATPPTNAGSYAVVATISEANYQGSLSATLVVQKATATIELAGLTTTYDGSPKSLTATTIPAGRVVSILYDGSPTPPTNAGNHPFTASVADANYQGESSGTMVIQKAVAAITLSGLTPTYDGNPKPVNATTVPAGRSVSLLYNGSPTPPSHVGNYTVTATVNDTNYQGDAFGTLEIGKATATVELAGLSAIYDGGSHPVTATTSPNGLPVVILYDGSSTPPVNAGNYGVTATVTDGDYEGAATGTLVIGKAAATVELSGLTATYDGNSKSVTATTNPPGKEVVILYDDLPVAPVNAGNYVVSAIVSDANYEGAFSGTLVVQKAEAAISFIGLSATYDGNPKPVSATTVPVDLSVAVLYDGSIVPPIDAGGHAITASITDANYQGSAMATLVIAPDPWVLWKNTRFTEEERLAGLAADSADPDADNLPNLVEYALNTDPRNFTPPLPGVRDETGFSLIFTRPSGLPGILYSVEASPDLGSWTPVPLEILETGAVETVRAREPFGPDPAVPCFLRLKIGRE